jgi:integrase
MTKRKKARYLRVYPSDGSWYWVMPGTNKWIRLCKVDDSEETLLERLLAEKKKYARPEGLGDARPLIDAYVLAKKGEHKEKAWPAYGKYAGNGFRNANVADIEPMHVSRWLKTKYKGKLTMQRTMRSFLSGFFSWCIEEGKGGVKFNPCRDIKMKKPKSRKVYITDDHFAAIREAMMSYTYKTRAGKTITGRINTGPMMQCFVDLCYLTVQRSTEIRLLTWKQVDEVAGVIHFTPTKTEDSSGISVDFTITPEITAVLARVREIDGRPRSGIQTVIHQLNGKPYGATGLRSAWDRAGERAKLTAENYNVKDIRAKAMTDAKRAGYETKMLSIAGAHSNERTTEIYFKELDIPVAHVRLIVPPMAVQT